MNKTLSVAAVAGIMLLASCGKQEPAAAGSDGHYPVSLSADVEHPGTRIIEEEDARQGLRTSWESGDRICVLYGDGEMVEMNSGEESAGHFYGEVETEEQAQTFGSSHHYGVNSLSPNISATARDGVLSAYLQLDGQDGSIESAAAHELLSASAPAGKKMTFTHSNSVIRLDVVSDLLGESISAMELFFSPDAESQPLFGHGVIMKLGPGFDSPETENDNASFCNFTFDPPLELRDGMAQVYIVIPERAPLNRELSIAATGSNGKTFRRYLILSDRAFPKGCVVARQLKFSQENEVPSVGDYYYIDGTWGPLEYYGDKYPIAVVISNYTSAADRAAGYTYGYAMALRDAAWPAEWGPENVDYPETPNIFEVSGEDAPLAMMENLDGLSTCTTLYDRYLSGNGWGQYLSGSISTVSAIPAAMEYGSEAWVEAYSSTPNTHVFETPATSSGWFLPSTGQWFLAFTGLGSLDPQELTVETAGEHIKAFVWKFSSAAEKQEYLNRFCNYFSSWSNPILSEYVQDGRIASTTFYLPYQGQMDWYLWASDEATSDGTASVVLVTSDEIRISYMPKTTGEGSSNGYAARAVLAF